MTAKPRSNAHTVAMLAGVVLVMGALSWAAVPFYSWFCRVTGFAGTTNVATAAPDTVLEETVTVRFDANVDPNLDWTFRPLQREMKLRIGENAIGFYEAVNNSDQPLTGTASYNVAPDAAGYFFNKIECFCFTEQTLAPGERVEMPVSFFVDPELVKDRDAGRIRDITLSYTFHRTDPPAPKQAALDAAAAPTVN
ncbi:MULTISPECIES: cytochrome c oxidase assembly protein [unclassified Paracoccus (in: a-proteobacteria)]|uniref:cytochrome c oxidase assembly protein n=1 Tax=unclassified Paracoccus (in: a-proteobacteria) TaxID=2688777 RepID=UPI0012B32E81|nr:MULTISPECIES: cytochrome c oxidase assembly protein [unclassified Paracoccus (in: a-proteobacteria)]UXU74025.1 cytochrome c oxidase assembly protein [Paracoccus sp. SMMA_5]UXU79913.1 cytochrome c oxidase assembly protein [Paracoccus sp. SMMA_5_TC]